MTSALSQFLREKKHRADEGVSRADWQKRKDRWLQSLRHLYDTIEGWLGDLKSDGTLTIAYEPIDMSEEHIGQYEAKSMSIRVGQESVVLEPLGTIVFGANGRVDVRSSSGYAMFVEREWDEWEIADRRPELVFCPLTEDSFAEVLKQIMAG